MQSAVITDSLSPSNFLSTFPPSLRSLPSLLLPPYLHLSSALSLLSCSPSLFYSFPSLRLSLSLSLPLLPSLLCSLPLGAISRPSSRQTSRENNACRNACTLTHILTSDPSLRYDQSVLQFDNVYGTRSHVSCYLSHSSIYHRVAICHESVISKI